MGDQMTRPIPQPRARTAFVECYRCRQEEAWIVLAPGETATSIRPQLGPRCQSHHDAQQMARRDPQTSSVSFTRRRP